MNKPVSFPLAKLLTEKGYEQNIEVGTICRIQNTVNKDYEKTRPIKQSDIDNLWSIFNEVYPTISDVVMWLYEKHGIWTEVRHIKTFNVNRFHVIIWDYKDTSDYMTIHCDNGVGYEVWDTPTEAYEAAIDYTLNNLI